MPSIHPRSRMPRLGNTVNTPMALLFLLFSRLLSLILSSLSFRPSRVRSRRCRRPSVGGLCVRAIRPACATSTSRPFHLSSSLGSLCTSICPSIRKPYLRQGNKRVNLDIMAATVAAHKTIVQDISLASPFRVSAPLYRHARFSFLFFSSSFFLLLRRRCRRRACLFIRVLIRLHGVLRCTWSFGATIMRFALDTPPMWASSPKAGIQPWIFQYRSW